MHHSHICASCRRRLAQIRPQRITQWQHRASFISLSNPKPQNPIPTDENLKEALLKLGDNVGDRKGRYAAILPGRKRRVSLAKRQNPGDELEALFEDALKGPESALNVDMPESNTTSQPISSALEPYKHVEVLKEMLQFPERTSEAWSYFLEHFDSASPIKRPSYFQKLANAMRNRLIYAKANDPLSRTLPSTTEICQVYLRMGLLQGWWWSDITLILVENILKLRNNPKEGQELLEILIQDLLGAWNVVCRPLDKIQHHRPPGSSLNWSHIPTISTRDIEVVYRRRGPEGSFAMLTPLFGIKQLHRLPLAVFGTFDVLADENCPVLEAISADITPFKALLSQFVSIPAFRIGQLSLLPEEKFAASMAQYVRDHFADIKAKATSLTSTYQIPKADYQPHTAHTRVETRFSFINKRVHDAMERRDLAQLDQLWADVVQWPVYQEAGPDRTRESKRGTISVELCNLFLLGFMTIRQPERSIDVWNHMVKCGITPNLQTWESMLSGCKIARHYEGLEEVWRKMHALNVKPDLKLWTTRIAGLVECRQFDVGIRALDEMGRLWLAAAKLKHPRKNLAELLLVDDVDSSPKPNIATVNAIISSLLFWNKLQPAKQILAWASRFGIEPDVITYNTLLKSFIKDGRTEDAMTLLHQMSAAGVQADVVTFTTILDMTFRSAELMTPEQQIELVHGTFRGMEQAGVRPNAHTYSKIIYELLQTRPGDLTVVNAVLERMGKQGLEPSPHIFTTLIEHYFDQDPPDLDVIRSLIHRASSVIGSSDHIFWDRVIEGYARIGETGAAVKVLSKVNMNKSAYPWRTLSTLMIALVQNEELEVARTIVRNAAKETGGPIATEVRGTNGQHIFWKNAFDLGLVDDDIAKKYDPVVLGVDVDRRSGTMGEGTE
jgi:pentatricopeptide repeat protein